MADRSSLTDRNGNSRTLSPVLTQLGIETYSFPLGEKRYCS